MEQGYRVQWASHQAITVFTKQLHDQPCAAGAQQPTSPWTTTQHISSASSEKHVAVGRIAEGKNILRVR